MNLLLNLSHESKVEENVIDLHGFGAPFERVTNAFTSITCNAHQFIKAISKNKAHVPIGRTEKRIRELTFDETKLRSFKDELKSKGIVTNIAIRQYLLQNDKVNECEFERSYTDSSSNKSSSNKLYQSHDVIRKAKCGYQWNDRFPVQSSRFENISIHA